MVDRVPARSEEEVVRKMAGLLKSGATMLEQTCPSCNVPLFRLKTGEVVCSNCGQRFVIVTSEEEELEVRGNLALQELEKVAVDRLAQVTMDLKGARDYSEVSESLDVALNILRLIDYARQIRKGHARKAG
ncbi:MAG: hypothetical protein NZ954_01565 [Thermofilaceae archaeon]|nr:hypothetical protein [Thermofilaceae archaeon]MCX8180441.1 hypothetical protein [Thermofilaceae archaeon]MDW8003362.1 Sjogren's syndrome/scleroderma autoantigen 1 family protein [Thermofilaceae archaeon]